MEKNSNRGDIAYLLEALRQISSNKPENLDEALSTDNLSGKNFHVEDLFSKLESLKK